MDKVNSIIIKIINKLTYHLINMNTSIILKRQQNKLEQKKVAEYYNYLCRMVNLLLRKNKYKYVNKNNFDIKDLLKNLNKLIIETDRLLKDNQDIKKSLSTLSILVNNLKKNLDIFKLTQIQQIKLNLPSKYTFTTDLNDFTVLNKPEECASKNIKTIPLVVPTEKYKLYNYLLDSSINKDCIDESNKKFEDLTTKYTFNSIYSDNISDLLKDSKRMTREEQEELLDTQYTDSEKKYMSTQNDYIADKELSNDIKSFIDARIAKEMKDKTEARAARVAARAASAPKPSTTATSPSPPSMVSEPLFPSTVSLPAPA